MDTEVIFLDYLRLLAPKITDELVYTSVGNGGAAWHSLKPREGNLYTTYMGGTSAMALGLALALPHRRVISLDSDGSILMGLTILPVIAHHNTSNLIIIVCDNERYEAAGSIPTFTAGVTDLVEIARGAGIKDVRLVTKLAEFGGAIDEAFRVKGTSFLVVKVKGSHPPVARQNVFCVENKFSFVRHIETTENLQILRSTLPKATIPTFGYDKAERRGKGGKRL